MVVDEITDGHKAVCSVVLGLLVRRRALLLSGGIVSGGGGAVHVLGPSSVGI